MVEISQILEKVIHSLKPNSNSTLTESEYDSLIGFLELKFGSKTNVADGSNSEANQTDSVNSNLRSETNPESTIDLVEPIEDIESEAEVEEMILDEVKEELVESNDKISKAAIANEETNSEEVVEQSDLKQESEIHSDETLAINENVKSSEIQELINDVEVEVEIDEPTSLLAPTLANGLTAKKLDQMPKPQLKVVQVMNGMVGKDYSVNFKENQEFQSIEILSIEPQSDYHLADFGLSFSQEDQLLQGTHKLQGEHKFTVIYNIKGKTELSSLSNRLILISVLPDPKSLWKTLDPPKDTIYQKSHSDFDSHYFDDYFVLGGSQRGRTHAHSGTFRDDDFAIAQLQEDVLLLIVADGAGSAKYSREGSKIACDICSETFMNVFSSQDGEEFNSLLSKIVIDKTNDEVNRSFSNKFFEIFGQAINNSKNKLLEIAKSHDHELRDYATTLLMCLVIKIESKYCVLSYGIGDGIIAHVNQENEVKLLTTPDGGQFAGQTRFLIMPEALSELSSRIKLTIVDDLMGLYLMTDGISDPFFETDANFKKIEKWNHLKSEINNAVDFSAENIESQFINWLDFFSKGNHDDRTLVFVNQMREV